MKKRKMALWGMAAAVTVMASLTAWAATAGETETVSVKVENVPGGALAVYYVEDEDGVLRYLPIGENVKIPKGSEIYWEYEPIEDMHIKGLDPMASTMLRWVAASSKSETVHYGDEFDNNDMSIVLEEDTVLTPKFFGEAEKTGSNVEISLSDRFYDSPSKAEVPVKVKVDGKEVPFTEEEGWTITEVNAKNNPDNMNIVDESWFVIKDGKIISEDLLPLGRYHIKLACNNENYAIGRRQITIWVGADVSKKIILAQYKNDVSGETTNAAYGWSTLTAFDRHRWVDKAEATVGDLVKRADEGVQANYYDEVIGYEMIEGSWRDDKGKIVTAQDTTLLKDLIPNEASYTLYPVYKKNGQEFKPVMIKALPIEDVQVYYSSCWVQENGKWFYYNGDGERVRNEWHENKGKEFFCGSDGAVITDGIAGTEDDLWLVDKAGAKETGFTGKKIFGMIEYTIEQGKVTGQTVVTLHTPSNATELGELADNILGSGSQLTPEQKTAAADMLVEGLTEKMKDSDKKKMTADEVRKIDEALYEAYGLSRISPSIDFDDEIEDEDIINEGATDFYGILAAAGVNSAMLGEDPQIETELKQLTATSSNARERIIRFRVNLIVNGEPVQLKSPILMYIGMPATFRTSYDPSKYTYSGTHIHSDETSEKFTPIFEDNGGTCLIVAKSFSEFVISQKTKSTSHTPSSRGGSARAASTVLKPSGEWKLNETGWWYRYNDGTYPKSQWVELVWNDALYWYYFNDQGYMETGWLTNGNTKYYLHPAADGNRGYMYTGWHEIDGKWYYFHVMEGGPLGAMAVNTVTPDGFTVGADGVWVQ